jgi:hypothetical protein
LRVFSGQTFPTGGYSDWGTLLPNLGGYGPMEKFTFLVIALIFATSQLLILNVFCSYKHHKSGRRKLMS